MFCLNITPKGACNALIVPSKKKKKNVIEINRFDLYSMFLFSLGVIVIMNKWRGIGLAVLTLLVACDVWLVYMSIVHNSDVPAVVDTLPPNITYIKEANIVTIDKARAFDNYYTFSSPREVEIA